MAKSEKEQNGNGEDEEDIVTAIEAVLLDSQGDPHATVKAALYAVARFAFLELEFMREEFVEEAKTQAIVCERDILDEDDEGEDELDDEDD